MRAFFNNSKDVLRLETTTEEAVYCLKHKHKEGTVLHGIFYFKKSRSCNFLLRSSYLECKKAWCKGAWDNMCCGGAQTPSPLAIFASVIVWLVLWKFIIKGQTGCVVTN